MPSSSPVILGIETSCDETAAAVVGRDGAVRSSVLSSQHDVHGKYGGVVPELAARRHIETVEGIVVSAMAQAQAAWTDLDGVAVTYGPGLAGALLVGVSVGKGLAYAAGLPLIAVNHLEAHMASAWMECPDLPAPCIVLVVSGGHTHLFHTRSPLDYVVLGHTLDDAAGEAFDKGAKMLGLEYPGGPAIDRLAQTAGPVSVEFPRPYLARRRGGQSLDFSFSGLKTSLLYYLRDLDRAGGCANLAAIAAGYQEAIVDVLVEKSFAAVERQHARALAVVGGVSANSRLRARLTERAAKEGISLALPRMAFCTDNAAMVAAAGRLAYLQGRVAAWDLETCPDLSAPARRVPRSAGRAKTRAHAGGRT
jgi:N6-L-threonylcarbamoyladenine synthase